MIFLESFEIIEMRAFYKINNERITKFVSALSGARSILNYLFFLDIGVNKLDALS